MIYKKLKEHIQKSEFHPNWLSLMINPFYLVRKSLFNEVTKCSQYITGNILDVGCGSKPYLEQFTKSNSYVGLEYDSPILKEKKLDVDFTYNGKDFPFEDNHFDSIVCFQVLEHVFEPEQFIAEIKRVLKKNGRLLITVPFCWDEHEQPFDYARYSSFGLKYLLEKNNFQVIYQQKTLANFSSIIQIIILYLYKKIPKVKYINYVVSFFIFFPLNVVGSIFNLSKTNSDLYMDNIIVVENRK